MSLIAANITALAQTDTGSAGYVVAAVVVSAVVLLAYLAIVALRVRDAATRLDRLEQQLDRPGRALDADADRLGVGADSEALPR